MEVKMFKKLKRRFCFAYRHSLRSGKGISYFIDCWKFSKEIIF